MRLAPKKLMNTQLAIVLGLLGISIAMFAMNRPQMDAVGLIALAASTAYERN